MKIYHGKYYGVIFPMMTKLPRFQRDFRDSFPDARQNSCELCPYAEMRRMQNISLRNILSTKIELWEFLIFRIFIFIPFFLLENRLPHRDGESSEPRRSSS